MKTETGARLCICGKRITGRRDKRFCSDRCRVYERRGETTRAWVSGFPVYVQSSVNHHAGVGRYLRE